MNKEVLIVEDDPATRIVLEEIFRAKGFVFRSRSNGSTAIELLKSGTFQPTVILMDIEMPIKSGVDVLDFLLENRFSIPVFIYSSRALEHPYEYIERSTLKGEPLEPMLLKIFSLLR